ncbi:MAG TPA: hypothetical protein PKK00_01195 [Bacteroidales bacterium]|nr:hypothetical protein [Bacteroidales bacterium]HPS16067.1 hypothetical protein [Bacteroidales bacterium]
MIEAFIKIRIKQISSILRELGLFRFFLLIGFIGFVLFILFMQTLATPNSFYSSGIFLFVISLIQINRSDKHFLKIHFINSKLILATEYLLMMIPLLTCLFYNMQWTSAISSIALIFLLVNIDFKFSQKSLNTFIQRLIPSDSFEWKSGARKTLVLIILIWILGLGTSFFVGSVPVAIFILGIIPLSFYEKGEQIQMILAYEMSTDKFLFHKIKMQMTLFTILTFPLIIAFLMFHHDKWYIPAVEFFILSTTHIYTILTKYAFYQPNKNSNSTQIFGIIGTMGIIIPVSIPIVWFLSIRFYIKSKKNLNFYLNDYN